MRALVSVPVEVSPAPSSAISKRSFMNEETTIAHEESIVFVTTETSLRESPDHKSRLLKRVYAGNKLLLLEKTNHLWWKVSVSGYVGWVKAALLSGQ
jgi:SH3-like domain-containing protein